MDNLTFWGAFLEGLLSFFSPCILPLLPVYLGYMSGTGTADASGQIRYDRRKTSRNTALFTLGVSGAFFLLALAATALGKMVQSHLSQFQIIAGILIILLALHQLGVISIPWLNKSGKGVQAGNGLRGWRAFWTGFLFSFSWTPCIGPTLSGIILLSASDPRGYLYILLYAAGLLIPLLLVGIFTGDFLNLFKKHRKLIPALSRIGAVLLLVMGGWSVYRGMQGGDSAGTANEEEQQEYQSLDEYDFVLNDVDGGRHHLSDYKGKTIVLNYFATWCTYCQQEIEVLREYAESHPDVQIVGVLEITDESDEEIREYLEEKDLPYPVLLDHGGRIGSLFAVQGYPTTYFINSNFEAVYQAPGMLAMEDLAQVVEDTEKTAR